jgi:hypothetical protein
MKREIFFIAVSVINAFGSLLIPDNSLRSSTSSLVSAISIVLVALTVLLSSLTSYCLVQKYRRKRADDTEIEFLTGDELLYFHTPSPHLRSHRGQNPEPEVDDNMRSF